jgi:hypothetical protein
MQINAQEIDGLERLNLHGGLEAFRAPLGKIFLPPDRRQWPALDFIRLANRFRNIPG